MAAFDFPSSPVNGQAFTPPGGTTYVWQNGAWTAPYAPGTSAGIPTADWANITNKPATFPPTLPIAQTGVTNLVADLAAKASITSVDAKNATQDTAINGKAATVHTHAQADVTNLVSDLALKAPLNSPVFSGTPTAPTPAAADSSLKLATTAFVIGALGINPLTTKSPPADADEFMLADSAASFARKKISWSGIKSTLKTYFDTLYAAVVHTHTTAQVTGLDTALAGKAASVHTHAQADVTNLVTDLAGKAPLSHTHTTAHVTGLDAALALLAPIAAPTFTGDAKAVTPPLGDNDTSIATSAFVQTAVSLTAQTAKTTIADADEFAIADSAAAFVRKKITWLNLKTPLKAFLDPFYAAVAHTHAQGDVTNLVTDLAGKAPVVHTHANVVASGAAGFMTGADKAKLDGLGVGGAGAFISRTTFNLVGSGDNLAQVTVPAGTRKVDIWIGGASANASGAFTFRIGPAAAVETSGYVCVHAEVRATPNVYSETVGFGMYSSTNYSGSDVVYGQATLVNPTGNQWVFTGQWRGTSLGLINVSGGKTIAGALGLIKLEYGGNPTSWDAGVLVFDFYS